MPKKPNTKTFPPLPELQDHSSSSATDAKKRTVDGAFKTAVDAISRMKQAPVAEMSLESTNAPVAAADSKALAVAPTTTKTSTSNSTKRRLTFQERLQELKAYGETYGTVNVPQTCKFNPSLGRWCHNMKYVYKRKSEGKPLKGYLNIADEQVQELRNLGFEFSMSDHTPRKSFQERLAQLQQFQKEHGHVQVPSSYLPDPSLGHWVGDARRGVFVLTEDQMQILRGMGFEFKAKSRAKNKSFEERLQECIEYKMEHGHPNVPQGYKHNPLLGQWCDQIRRSYAKLMDSDNTGKVSFRLTPHKIQMLKDIGVSV